MHGGLRFGCAVAAGLLPFLLGCGSPQDSLNRQPVSGSVTLKGQPLDRGSISLETQNSAQGTSGGAVIENGEFSISRQRGLPPGSYTVRIYSPDPTTLGWPAGEAPGESRREPQERVPAAWNTKSAQTVVVEDGGENRFDLAIP
ncbi:carboxypeptidase-like regulatory domain-containing protein [Blastopirellula marina]|uniref:Carboxypeptidase regulatory-like domain-containing protein n=1 Tax=Blastopirellula marina DSM 3645 TaxID=314230 RepID=A3ZNC1_9BACT|nr:carboxypeptidase-like regulatory domain-containing protein [Blastopirellula marina]EAQ81816.1 hypothetical protein DSM3645_16730 [Blastopirellula marina DSM 3645]